MVKLELIKTAQATEIGLDKLNEGWQHNITVLQAFFEVCVRNWKEWCGRRPAELIPRINGTYIQATQGDYVDESAKSVEHAQRDATPSYAEWKRLKGVDKDTAKRRFITLLRSIDTKLLTVKPQPTGYTLTTEDGIPICPWANSVRGCPMPLLDQDGTPLTSLVEKDMESFKSEVVFRRWIAAHEEHACWVGVHVPIHPMLVRPYLPWFNQKIVGGFRPYDYTAYRQFIKTLVDRQAAHFQHLMDTSRQHRFCDVERELDGLLTMIRAYKIYANDDYTYEVECTRTDHHCNMRRETDRGLNHRHPIVLSMMGGTFSSEEYEKVALLREECRKVGLSVQTGPTKDLEQRYKILRERFESFQKQRVAVEQARERLNTAMKRRAAIKVLIPAKAAQTMNDNLRWAITLGHMSTLPRVIELGANKDEENAAGMTALMRAVVCADVDLVKRLVIDLGCELDYMSRTGMSAMSWACKLGKAVMVETLLDLGADVAADGGALTPFMVAVRCNHAHVVEMVLEYMLKDIRWGPRGVDRALNAQAKRDGITALMLAARHRNFGMVRQLLRRNANRYLRDRNALSAEGHARKAGWRDIADFLATTRAVGPAGSYSPADEAAERDIRESSTAVGEELREHGAGKKPSLSDAMSDDPAVLLPKLQIMIGVAQPPSAPGGGGLDSLDGSNARGGNNAVRSPKSLQPADLPFPIRFLRGGHVAPDLETGDGSTSLICAAFAGDVKLVRLLLQEGASVDYDNINGKTALMAAANGGSLEMCVELLEKGADITRMDMEGRNAVRYATEGGHAEVSRFLGLVTAVGLEEALRRGEQKEMREAEDLDDSKRRKLFEAYGVTERDRADGDYVSYTWRIEKPDVPLRCWKCTLVVPCKHFKDKKALKASVPYPEKQWQWHHQPRGFRRDRRMSLSRRLEEAKLKKEREQAEALSKKPLWARTPRTPKRTSQSSSDKTPPQSPDKKRPHSPTRSSPSRVHPTIAERPLSPTPVRTASPDPTHARAPTSSSSSSSDVKRLDTRGSDSATSQSSQSVRMIDSRATDAGRLISTAGSDTGSSLASRPTSVEQQRLGTQDSQAPPLATIHEASKPKKPTGGIQALWEGKVPLHRQFANVRHMLAPRPHRDFSQTMPAKLLMRLGRSDAFMSRLLSHGTSAQERAKVQAEDGKIMTLRSIVTNPPPSQPPEPSHASVCGFVTVAVRFGMCVFGRCSRCEIGYAKLRVRGLHARALCDVCILLRVTTGKGGELDNNPDDPDRVESTMSAYLRVKPLSLTDALDATLQSLPDDCDPQHLLDGSSRSLKMGGSTRGLASSSRSQRMDNTSRGANFNFMDSSTSRPSSPSAFASRPTSSSLSIRASRPMTPTTRLDGTDPNLTFLSTAPLTLRAASSSSGQLDQEATADSATGGSLTDDPYVRQSSGPRDASPSRGGSPKKVSSLMQTLQQELIDSLPLARRSSMVFASSKDLGQAKKSQKIYDEEPGVYVRSRNLDLADFLLDRGKADEAEGLLLKTLQDHTDTFGRTHVSVALILRSLGMMEELRGLLPLARAYRETSFELLSTMFGPCHRETFRAANLLARSLMLQERYADAIFFYKELARQLRATHRRSFYDQADLYESAVEKIEAAQKTRLAEAAAHEEEEEDEEKPEGEHEKGEAEQEEGTGEQSARGEG